MPRGSMLAVRLCGMMRGGGGGRGARPEGECHRRCRHNAPVGTVVCGHGRAAAASEEEGLAAPLPTDPPDTDCTVRGTTAASPAAARTARVDAGEDVRRDDGGAAATPSPAYTFSPASSSPNAAPLPWSPLDSTSPMSAAAAVGPCVSSSTAASNIASRTSSSSPSASNWSNLITAVSPSSAKSSSAGCAATLASSACFSLTHAA